MKRLSIHSTLYLLALVLLVAASPRAGAQSGFGDVLDFNLKGQGESRPEVIVTGAAQFETVSPGQQFAIAITLDHDHHWHSWPSEAQDVLPPEIAEFAIRTAIEPIADPQVLRFGEIQWPTPKPGKVVDPMGNGTIEVPLYQGMATAFVPVEVLPGAALGHMSVELRVESQSCNDRTCLMPRDDLITVGFEIASASGAQSDAELFAGLGTMVFTDAGGAGPSTTGTSEQSEATSETSPTGQFFGLSLPSTDGPLGILFIALFSALGGLILNLTPCVLPVIPIKIMTLSQHGGSPKRAMMLGWWMAAGVVAFWLAIGLPVAFVNTISDPSKIFGIWWLTTAMGVLIAAMGLGLMGMFNITLPQSVYKVNPKADSPFGSFMFGVMTAVLGLPCFGFVAGALLPIASTLGSLTVVIVFAAIGVGMASPYLILSAKPSLVEKLPRTGPASDLVKQIMGLLLLAAAAYFIGAGLLALSYDMPYISTKLHYWAVALCGVVAGGWLILRTIAITKKFIPRAVFGVIGLVLGASGVLIAASATSHAKAEWIAKKDAESQMAATGEILTTTWVNHTDAVFDRAIQTGKVVVVDFTAEWCINCKALKAAVLNKDPVKPVLTSPDVIMIKADLTSRKADGWEFLRSLGQTGIPTLAIFGPGLSEPRIFNAYTSDQVLDAIDDARSEVTARAPLADM